MTPENCIIESFQRTKIVCTLGPSTDKRDILRGMIAGGMDVARINLSHGTMDEHLKQFDMVREISSELGEHVAIMFDTNGPDMRIGDLKSNSVELVEGGEFVLSSDPSPGDSNRVSISFPGLSDILTTGDRIYLADGLIELSVIKTAPGEIVCKVVSGGTLKPHKGINCPGKDIPLPILDDNDIEELKVGAEKGIDYIAASFVRNTDDLAEIRKILSGYDIPIVAKIESASGVANLDEIIESADGIMVARGDLGIEIPPEEVPGVQKKMIAACIRMCKPVITATEMLESMTHSPRPTRAEIADVANAVLDGTSAVMLSAETAVGDFPVETVQMMSRVCQTAERDLLFRPTPPLQGQEDRTVREGIAHAASLLASDICASAIICVTDSGETARVFSHYHPTQPVLACTPSERIARQLSMYWGILPVIVDEQESVEALLQTAIEKGRGKNLVKTGDRIVFTGNLSGRGGETNLLASVEV